MRIAYLEPFSGASGDMLLGALFDAGLSRDDLLQELSALQLPELAIDVTPAAQHGISGTHAVVRPETGHHARAWRDIRALIAESGLPEPDKRQALEVFGNLAAAEATVHAVPVEDVHFHEVGALDTIVDIVGVVVGLRMLGIEQLYAAPVHVGGGTVRAAHGMLPVPAPATARLLATLEMPVASPMDGELAAGELLTPTGAAIIGTLATFERPPFTPHRIGIGFGSKALPWANMLRIMIGESSERTIPGTAEPLLVIETNIDDMSPQFYDILIERLFAAGCLDAWTSPIQMKKGRPAVCLAALARPADQDQIVALLIENSTTLGVRITEVNRIAADRRFESVGTKWGEVRIKLKIWKGRVLDVAPEYDDCAAIARSNDIEIRSVWREAYRLGEVFIGRRADSDSRLMQMDPGGRSDRPQPG